MSENNEKFYIQIDKTGNDMTTVSRCSNQFFVDIELLEKNNKCLKIHVSKYGNGKDNSIPPSDAETQIKIITKDTFNKYFSKFLQSIHQLDRSSGEFYYLKSYGKVIVGVAWFSENERDKKNILISLDNEKDDFYFTITCTNNWKNIQHFRRAGNTIEIGKYNTFFKVVLKYIHDRENYVVNYFDIISHFKRMLTGDIEEQESKEFGSWQPDNSKIIDAVSNRISAIERRLMEIDSDTLEERIKMRGELEGLQFALNIAKTN
jgi:hypothetical protein